MAEAMGFSSIRPVRSDGVVRNLTQHFHLALGTGCVSFTVSDPPEVIWNPQKLQILGIYQVYASHMTICRI